MDTLIEKIYKFLEENQDQDIELKKLYLARKISQKINKIISQRNMNTENIVNIFEHISNLLEEVDNNVTTSK